MPSPRQLAANAWEGWLQQFPTDEGALSPFGLARLRTSYRALEERVAAERRLAEYLAANTVPQWDAARAKKLFVIKSSGVRLSLADRLAVVGYTGCGKTTLAREWATAMHRLFPMASLHILDSKGDELFDGDPDIYAGNTLPPLPELGGRVIWRPDTNDLGLYDAWFEQLLRAPRHPMIVWIDELSSLGGEGNSSSFPHNYILLLKQGRSLQKHVMSLTQEAAYIPRQVLGQTTHLVRMRLIDEYDARKLDRIVHGKADTRHEPAGQYGLWYRRLNVQGGLAREFRSWRELLGAA